MRLRASFRTAHRWLALLLGLQLAVWAASGVALSFIPDALARGDASRLPDFTPDLEARSYASPGGVIAQMGRATEVRLTRSMGRVVYVAHGPESSALFDARTAERLSPLTEQSARLIATQDFAGSDDIRHATQVTMKDGTPAWRIAFSDPNKTTLFVSAQTGEIAARQNRYSTLRGFFQGLHVMDYSGGGDRHNPLLQLAGVTSVAFALTGLGLIVLRWRDGRYRLPRTKPRLAAAPENPATIDQVTPHA
jgi:uncharacterized iron-regulated membrane protein